MPEADSRNTARNLIAMHGLRAHAVVQERLAEARGQSDPSGMQRWQNVEAEIHALREAARHAADLRRSA